MDFFKGTVTTKDWMAVGAMVVIMLAIIVVYIFFIHAGQKRKLDELNARNLTLESDLREAIKKQEGIEELREQTRKIDLLVEEFEKRLPTQREIPNLVRQFEGMANEVGLSHSLRPGAPIRDEHKETIPYTVSTFGDFHQTVSFINRLERFERYLKISDLKIDEEDAGVSTASFTLSTFRFIGPNTPAPTTTASAAAPAPSAGGSS